MAGDSSFSVQVNDAQMRAVQSMLSDIRLGAEKAIKLAINKTIQTTKVQIAKKLGEKINLPAKRIKKDIKPDTANMNKLSGSIVISGKPIGLVNFAGSQLKKGVKVKVYKDGASTLIRHAFIATVKGRTSETDKEHLFWREYFGNRQRNAKILNKRRFFPGVSTKTGAKWGAGEHNYRYRLSRRTSIRIEDVLAKPEILTPIETDAANLFVENIDYSVNEILRRHAAGV